MTCCVGFVGRFFVGRCGALMLAHEIQRAWLRLGTRLIYSKTATMLLALSTDVCHIVSDDGAYCFSHSRSMRRFQSL
jgi:hypothetical protein